MDAEADQQRRPAQPLPRAVGPAEDGGRGEHHHHPRCRQTARPTLAVLAPDHAALIHRPGQDHASRPRPRPPPRSCMGWGKTTQLGMGLGLAMGAKLAKPDKLCINVWGDAAIGFTGMDFETAVREKIPILSILLNNISM